ncbi:unnamed protein product, partial [Amoebophrya sp. A25]
DRLQSEGRLRSNDRRWSIGRGSRCLRSTVFLRLLLCLWTSLASLRPYPRRAFFWLLFW